MTVNKKLIRRSVLSTYRFGHWVYYSVKMPGVRHLLLLVYAVLDMVFVRIAAGSEIPAECHIGKGFQIPHATGIVIRKNVRIGDNVVILHQVTIGANPPSRARKGGSPKIGNNVYIGAGAKILGPVSVGDNARIGANAVVVQDVPANATAVGVPARVVRES